MRTFFTLMLATSLIASPVLANHEGHAHEHDDMSVQSTDTQPAPSVEGAACEDTVTVKVNGLVCDFCARALEKVFSKREDVAGIQVDLDKGNVVIAMQPGQTIDDATLTQLITDSGYSVTGIDKGC